MLAGAAAAVAILYLLDRLLLSPWIEEWETLGTQIEERRRELDEARSLMEREDRVKREWTRMEARLTRPPELESDVALLGQIKDLGDRAGVSMTPESSRRIERPGGFFEVGCEVSLEADIVHLRDLLLELYNSEEFLKVHSLSVISRALDRRKSDRLGVDLKLSTIEFAPERARRGTRNGSNGGRKP